MNEKYIFEHIKTKGWRYNQTTGEVFSHTGKLMNNVEKSGYIKCCIKIDKIPYRFFSHRFAWFYIHGIIPDTIDHINRIKFDNRLINLRNISKKENTYNTRISLG